MRRYKWKSVEVSVFKGVGHFECKLQTEGALPTNHCWCQKARVIALSCGRAPIDHPFSRESSPNPNLASDRAALQV